MAKAAVLPFKPRVIDCDADTKELLEALVYKAKRGELAGLLVTMTFKDGDEQTCSTGLLRDTDKAIGAASRTWRLLSDA